MGMVEKKILVVDDDEAARFLISNVFHICETGCALITERNRKRSTPFLGMVGNLFLDVKECTGDPAWG
jgi:CheY-like chemotaxis protein